MQIVLIIDADGAEIYHATGGVPEGAPEGHVACTSLCLCLLKT